MAAISSGVVGYSTLCEKGLVCDDRSLLLHKVAGCGSSRGLSKWWLPIFGWTPDEKWAEEVGGCGESAVQNTADATENVFKADEEEICVTKQSKFVAVRFTAEKAKLLRKNLRSTSSFHDLMYHSAIASRLASADSSSEE